jgi:serine/threonine protein kinase
MSISTGHILQNRYHITQSLGGGGFGTVYLANDTRLSGRQVAIKMFDPNNLPLADRSWAMQAFQQEAGFLANLCHNGIASVTDYFNEQGLSFLVMDYVAGETLEQAMKRAPGGRFTEAQVIQWADQLCQVLHYLHSQQPPVIFRDLKPANIIVQQDGTLKLIDFGIARHFKPGQSHDTQALGTPGYAAPEQYGHGQTDGRADIYALGVILHQLLTGHDPTLTPMHLPPIGSGASPALAAAINKATQIDPAQRFNDVLAFRQAMTASTTIPLFPAQPGRKPPWLVVGGAAFLVFIILAFLLMRPNDDLTAADPTATLPIAAVSDTPPAAADTPTHPPEPTETPIPPGAGEAAVATVTVTKTIDEPSPTSPPTPTDPPTPTNPPPTPTALTQYIIFDSTRGQGLPEIFIMSPDGTGQQQQLTTNSSFDAEADLSPDGQWIAYESGSGSNWTIYVMRRDGTDRRSLVAGREPAWSPDGRTIAYETTDSREIWTIDVDSGVRQQVSFNNLNNRAPDWSPDGRQLVVMVQSGGWQLFILDLAGGSERQITSGGADKRFPVWSPDGDLIAYNTLVGSDVGQIYTIEIDGSNPTQLTSQGQNGRPSWSPDGNYLAFNSNRAGEWYIYTMRRDGSEQTQITFAGDDQRPDWGPK